jgi:hypothetical protein
MDSEILIYGAAAGAAISLILAILAVALALGARARTRAMARRFAEFDDQVRALDARFAENRDTLMRIRAFQAPRGGGPGDDVA